MDPIKPPEGLPEYERAINAVPASLDRYGFDPLFANDAGRAKSVLSITLDQEVARHTVLRNPERRTYRKHARILAIRSGRPFVVTTDRGPMEGEAGDYLVTNHPDDDPGSDTWTISAERLAATYDDEEDIRPATKPEEIRAWLEFNDRLANALAYARARIDESDGNFPGAVIDVLDPPAEPTNATYVTLERAVDAGFNVHLIAGSSRGSSYRFVELDRNGLLVAGQGSTLSEAVARARTKFEADYPEPHDG